MTKYNFCTVEADDEFFLAKVAKGEKGWHPTHVLMDDWVPIDDFVDTYQSYSCTNYRETE